MQRTCTSEEIEIPIKVLELASEVAGLLEEETDVIGEPLYNLCGVLKVSVE